MYDAGSSDGIKGGESSKMPFGSLRLHEHLEGDEVRHLLAALRMEMRSGLPVSLSAAGVKKVSTLALQVLVAAKAMAVHRSQSLGIEHPSPEFLRACTDTGLGEYLNVGELVT
jgi:anti-anti-sigma regulatory factor